MTAVTVSALAELEQRAGAPDTDREAWLAERKQGVTATEVRDLAIKGPTFKRELIEKKLGILPDDFAGNAYTRWGKEREPIIAARIDAMYGIADEHRVFRAADNPRFLASPDGVGEDFDGSLVVSEIKTSGHDVAPGTPKYDEVGYALQQQWSMRVTGARRCLYAWERRWGRPEEGFEPGDLRMAWVEYDEATVRKLEAIAVDFLDALDAARAQLEAGEEPEIDEEIDTLAVNVLRGRELEAEAKALKEPAWRALQALVAQRGEPVSQKSTLAQVTYSPAVEVEVEVVDEEAARAADPLDLWGDLVHLQEELGQAQARWEAHAAQFTARAVQVGKASLTVTQAKATRKAKA